MKFSTLRRAGLALGLLVPLALSAHAETAELTIQVKGIREMKGRLMVGVFDRAGYENDGQPIANADIPVSAREAVARIKIAVPGRYGVKLFHDVNGDGKLNTNAFGIPTEPYAFSNNADGSFGPPKWDKAAFDLKASGLLQVLKLD